MPNDGSSSSTSAWPTARFQFDVRWGDGTVMHFQEISGLETETQVIEYRHGNSPVFAAMKMPGLVKYGNVTLKKGSAPASAQTTAWFNAVRTNTVQRATVTIRLLDERGAPAMVCTLAKAWPRKLTGTDLNPTGDQWALETIEIAHEGMTLAQA
ncbi:MAG: phage tail protein [Rubrivivax sp.]|nr:phage tail protein [Rubrivivax sp.]